jgi:hypothetical protein
MWQCLAQVRGAQQACWGSRCSYCTCCSAGAGLQPALHSSCVSCVLAVHTGVCLPGHHPCRTVRRSRDGPPVDACKCLQVAEGCGAQPVTAPRQMKQYNATRAIAAVAAAAFLQASLSACSVTAGPQRCCSCCWSTQLHAWQQPAT